MIRTIKWGILGAGGIAAKVAADMAHAPHAKLQAVASRDPSKAKAFAAAHGAPGHYGSYQALVEDPAVDAVYIATPNNLHLAHAKLALGASKPVLVEKPFALNAAEAREISDLARTHGVFCMEAMWARFLPTVQAAREAIAKGAIGKPMLLRSELGFAAPLDAANRFSDPGLGGGALLDLGVYSVSLAHHLFGPPASIAAGHSVRSATGVDTQTSAILSWPDKAAVIVASHANKLSNEVEIVGDNGRLTISEPFLGARQFRVMGKAPTGPSAPSRESAPKKLLKALGLWSLARSLARGATGRDGRISAFEYPGEGYQFQLEEVAACLSAGKTESALMPLEESIAVMATIDRIRAASA